MVIIPAGPFLAGPWHGVVTGGDVEFPERLHDLVFPGELFEVVGVVFQYHVDD